MCENDEIIQEFIGEGNDMLDEVEPLLIDLQNTSSDTGGVDEETINTIFRTFHSIKGSAGFLEFNVVNRLTHNAETLLDLFRKGKATIALEHIEILCQSIDFLKETFSEIEARGTDKDCEIEADKLVGTLKTMIQAAGSPESAAQSQ
ncbi:MAG: Hpt domain-containing protein, partial [Planctomycetes bacterium]|nr:Hpt domain-containing protein [Planctomycetota bacterium]